MQRLFREIEGSTFVNPDYTLWEIAYLRGKGLDDAEIKSYRQHINELTAAQMLNGGAPKMPADEGVRITSRDAFIASNDGGLNEL